MHPTHFPEANTTFGPPPDMDESQVARIPARLETIRGGNLDGQPVVVVAWQPSPEDRARIAEGAPIYLMMCGGLSPHALATEYPL